MKPFYSSQFTLGILGGGQLGRMLINESIRYNVQTAVLDPSLDSSCRGLAGTFVCGDFSDYDTVYQFGQKTDTITIEIEHVNLEALIQLEKEGKRVYPQPRVLEVIQDKGLQKEFYKENGIPTAPFYLIENANEAKQRINEGPFMQKLRKGGYDGKGVQALQSAQDFENAWNAPSVLEKWVSYEKEIAVIVARNERGEMAVFPLVEMGFNSEANLVETLFSPAEVSSGIAQKAEAIARQLALKLGVIGILAVEMFVTKEGEVLVNEIAPRPHNSGHHTIECCVTSQYEQHIRAILNMPLGSTRLIEPAVMINLLGSKGHEGEAVFVGLDEALKTPGVYVHLYGKRDTKPFRKMGHITVMREDLSVAKTLAKQLLHHVQVTSV